MAKVTHRDMVAGSGPAITKGYWASRFLGVVALLFDVLGTAISNAIRAPFIRDTMGPAYDALDPLGAEQRAGRYPGETWLAHKKRLAASWTTSPYLGTSQRMLDEFTAAGFPGAEFKSPVDWPAEEPVGWWSQFWINFPEGTHTVTSAGYPVGSWTVGAATIGAEGIDQTTMRTMRKIVRENKPGHWVCRAIRFQLGGGLYADISV